MSQLTHLKTVMACGKIPVHKYRSEKTGMTVIIGEVEGPLVNGYFTLATEAHDDDGLPHTLEHLIFLGSELYPYKGILDLLANRCLASGTNAWTDTDHTCYTIKTVGRDGFLELLPIYLDHILFPTLSDSGFATEVHHVNGDGKDCGVVYCEMQGRENTAESRASLAYLRDMYPNSGYSAETGGILHNLRTSTTNEKVRDYHGQFYRPENLTLIITGQVGVDAVAKALESVEARILSKPKKPDFVRPWFTPIEPLAESIDRRIVYPSDEEDCGIVSVGWRGPNCSTDILTLTACSTLIRYLSETSVSPLQRDMVEINDPYASTVSYNIIENFESTLYFSFQNVPLQKVDGVFGKMKSILSNIANGKEKIDMKRMNNILERCLLECYSSFESTPHEAIAFPVIADILYGQYDKDFEMRLNSDQQMKDLLAKDEQYWIGLLKKFLIDGHSVTIRAVPSVDEQKRMAKTEADRIQKQRDALGAAGLAKKADELEKAMAENEIPPPNDVLTGVPIPDTSTVDSLSSTVQERGGEVFGDASKLNGLNLDDFPLPISVTACGTDSNFGYMIVYFNTSEIPTELKPYFLLFLDLILASPIRRSDGTLTPYEDVVAALESDTVDLQASLGIGSRAQFTCGSYSETALLLLKTDHKKYMRGIEWIDDLLNRTEFNVDRIRVCTSKIVNAVSQAKRNANTVTSDLIKSVHYNFDSNMRRCSMIHQQRFLNEVLEKLDKPDEAARIIDNLNQLRSELLQPARLGLYIAADWNKILSAHSQEQFYDKWSRLLPNVVDTSFDKSTYVNPSADYRLRKKKTTTGQTLGLGGVDGSFLSHAVPCSLTIDDPEYIPLMLFLQYLTQLEGPFWRQLRGQGLTYGYNMCIKLNERLLYFTLYRSTNVTDAFKQFQQITESYLSADSTWDPTLLESAKSSLIFEFVEQEKSIDTVVLENFQTVCFQRGKRITDINQANIGRIQRTTIDDMVAVGKKYVQGLFTADARTTIVCHSDKAKHIRDDFDGFGFRMTVSTNIEKSILGESD